MSQFPTDQRPEAQLSKDLEFPFFESQLPAAARVVVSLDRQQPLRSLFPTVEADIDTNCACE
jgi:hypothetical protein